MSVYQPKPNDERVPSHLQADEHHLDAQDDYRQHFNGKAADFTANEKAYYDTLELIDDQLLELNAALEQIEVEIAEIDAQLLGATTQKEVDELSAKRSSLADARVRITLDVQKLRGIRETVVKLKILVTSADYDDSMQAHLHVQGWRRAATALFNATHDLRATYSAPKP